MRTTIALTKPDSEKKVSIRYWVEKKSGKGDHIENQSAP
jgi:hypothetical protein